MTTPTNLKYAASHEWAKLETDGTALFQVGDILYMARHYGAGSADH